MIGSVPRFGHISEFMRDTLHWLPVSGSTFTIGSPPLFGVVSSALRMLTYWSSLSSLRPALADNLSALPPEVTFWCLMLAWPINSIGPSRLWVPLLGTVSHLNSSLCPARFISSSKLLFSLGAPLSSYSEVALYKFHRQIDR